MNANATQDLERAANLMRQAARLMRLQDWGARVIGWQLHPEAFDRLRLAFLPEEMFNGKHIWGAPITFDTRIDPDTLRAIMETTS